MLFEGHEKEDIIGMVSDSPSPILLKKVTSISMMLFEGHGKEDIIGTISDPPFSNLVQGSDNNEHDAL